MKFFTPKFMKIRWSSFYSTFKVASSLINSKRGRQFFLEIMKAYGRKTRKFIIAPKMALHWHESHSMICSLGIDLIKGN
jgi:hypothetical protein